MAGRGTDGDFATLLHSNFGLRPSGKNAPMASAAGRNKVQAMPASNGRQPGGPSVGPNASQMGSSASKHGGSGMRSSAAFYDNSSGGTEGSGVPKASHGLFGAPSMAAKPPLHVDDGLLGGLGQATAAESFPRGGIFGAAANEAPLHASNGDVFGNVFGTAPHQEAPGVYGDLLGDFGSGSAGASPAKPAHGKDDLLGGFASSHLSNSAPTPAFSTTPVNHTGAGGLEPAYDDLFGPPPPPATPAPEVDRQSTVSRKASPVRMQDAFDAMTSPPVKGSDPDVHQEHPPDMKMTGSAEEQGTPDPHIDDQSCDVWVTVGDIFLTTQPSGPPPSRRPPPPPVPTEQSRRSSGSDSPRRVSHRSASYGDTYGDSPQSFPGQSGRWQETGKSARQQGDSGTSPRSAPETESGNAPVTGDRDVEEAANAAAASAKSMAEALERASKRRSQSESRRRESTKATPPKTPPRPGKTEVESVGSGVRRPSWGSADDLAGMGKKHPSSEDLFANKDRPASHSASSMDNWGSAFGVGDEGTAGVTNEDSEERRAAKLAKAQRSKQRQADALAEKHERDAVAANEQEERHRCDELYGPEIKRWAAGKDGNLRAMLSTLHLVLWPELSWQPVMVSDLVTGIQVKKVYQKAILRVHPDKVQQKGADVHQKYIASKVFDLLKEAYTKFTNTELF